MGNQWGRKATTQNHPPEPYDTDSASFVIENPQSAKRTKDFHDMTPKQQAQYLESAYERMQSDGERVIKPACIKKMENGVEVNLKGNWQNANN